MTNCVNNDRRLDRPGLDAIYAEAMSSVRVRGNEKGVATIAPTRFSNRALSPGGG